VTGDGVFPRLGWSESICFVCPFILFHRHEFAALKIKDADRRALRANPVLFGFDWRGTLDGRFFDGNSAIGTFEGGQKTPKTFHLPFGDGLGGAFSEDGVSAGVFPVGFRTVFLTKRFHVFFRERISDFSGFLFRQEFSAEKEKRFPARVAKSPPRVRQMNRFPAVGTEKFKVSFTDLVHSGTDSI